MTSVLVVEDDQMFARAVGRDLAEQGFVVSVVHNVPDALSALAGGPVDVLVTDLQLGAQDGIDLLESLRDTSPRTRAVLMSGFASARDYQRAIELGAVRVLCKPFTPTDLIDCIRQAVECETGFRGSVHGLSLVDILQMFNYGRRSVTISVAGASPGRLHLRGGRIVHVEHEGRAGETALRSLLAMPAGTLSTTALASDDVTITREFREVLLDALRAVDEEAGAARGGGSGELDLDADLDLQLEPVAEPAPAPPAEVGPAARVLERVRAIDGYIAASLVLSKSGGVISYDGRLDLRPVARFVAEVVRCNQRTIVEMGLDDEAEDMLITGTHQYHLLRCLHSEVPAFVHVVLDREATNPVLAKLALASAVRSCDL